MSYHNKLFHDKCYCKALKEDLPDPMFEYKFPRLMSFNNAFGCWRLCFSWSLFRSSFGRCFLGGGLRSGSVFFYHVIPHLARGYSIDEKSLRYLLWTLHDCSKQCCTWTWVKVGTQLWNACHKLRNTDLTGIGETCGADDRSCTTAENVPWVRTQPPDISPFDPTWLSQAILCL